MIVGVTPSGDRQTFPTPEALATWLRLSKHPAGVIRVFMLEAVESSGGAAGPTPSSAVPSVSP